MGHAHHAQAANTDLDHVDGQAGKDAGVIEGGVKRLPLPDFAEPVAIPTSRVMALVERTPTEVVEALENAAALLS